LGWAVFFDHAKIHVAAGNGGSGSVSFRRERYVPHGGPDGGDGGRGGDVILEGDPQLRDLQQFTYEIHFKAQPGEAGHGARKHGANGESISVHVPLGTQVWTFTGARPPDEEDGGRDTLKATASGPAGEAPDELPDGELLADIVWPGQRVIVARGGMGGRGNARFANSVRQAPKFAELGEAAESSWLRLSLKLMADAGLAGLPNAGKSSLLRRLSNAKPKVAAYPFTTLEPMLGVVDWSGEGDVFTLADVPGLLEGASEGVGLGHEFLAHLERCRLLLHVVDVTGYYGAESLEGFRTILSELDAHATGLAEKPQVILLNKVDAVPGPLVEEQLEVFAGEIARLRKEGHPAFSYLVGDDKPRARQCVWPVSAATGAGIADLLRWVGPLLLKLWGPAGSLEAEPGEEVRRDAVEATVEPSGHVTYRPLGVGENTFVITRDEQGFAVRGEGVRRLVSRFDLDNEEASRYLGERLDRLGVYSALRARGARPGDEVDIEGHTFEFQ
jgi:GTP-binding protein